MIEEGIKQFEDMAVRASKVNPPVYEDTTRKVFVEHDSAGGITERTVKLPARSRNHSFNTLDGFLDYLNSRHTAEDDGIIFVGEKLVKADLRYKQAIETHEARLMLEDSDEMKALQKLISGIGQKELWRLLITDLDGKIDDALLLAIGALKIAAKAEAKAEIDVTGITSESASNVVRVTFQAKENASETASIRVDWIWHGRVWSCFKEEYDIRLRLELDADGKGIRFIFHPRGLEDVLRTARADLVAEIDTKIPKDHFTVHEGAY